LPNSISAIALLVAPHHLRAFDLALVAVYLIGITLFGLRFRERRGKKSSDPNARSLRSYFLANNTIPWWAISLSIVSAETSTLTIISIPGVAFAGDFGFLQIVIGYMLGRIVVALIFLPRYFSGNMLTAYQLIDNRFGPALHKVTAGLFLLTRAAAEGVRVFAVSIVVGIAIGTRDVLSIAIISILTLLYTFEGGLAAVIWTDVVQMAIYIGGTVVAIATLGTHVTGGWTTIHTVASAAGKFHMLNFAFNLTTTYTFWAGVLGGTFLTMASHGTDQLMVQRMLAARNLRESRLALLSSGVVIFIQFALFLLIGVGLYVFAQQATGPATNPGAPFMTGLHPGMSGIPQPSWITNLSPDRIFPTFIVHEMPIGIAGLLVAAILAAAMSNLSAALNSLSSTTVVDFYMHLRPQADDRERNLISKSSTILWALVLFAIAVYSLRVGGKGHVVEIGLSISAVAWGCLLGVFLLGTLTKFATQTGATIGMLCGFILNIALWQFPGKALWTSSIKQFDGTTRPGPFSITIPQIAFTWYVLIGAIVTFAIGSLASLIFRKQSKRTIATTTAAITIIVVILSAASRPCNAQSTLQNDALLHPTPNSVILSAGAGHYPAPQSKDPETAPTTHTASAFSTSNPPTPDFTPITTLINTAIAAHKLPGAVVLIGHNNRIVFEQAYGNRKLANEPGLDGKPSPAEPMTEDTIFDMASLTKDLATAVAIMQLYEQGKISSFDDPVAKYLPEFADTANPTAAPSANGAPLYQPGATPHETPTFDKSHVTLRMLLTHTSGEPPDVDLRDPWGLTTPDKAEGIHRALTTPLKAAPGTTFEYSDSNFILLGDLVETLSNQPLDVYAQDHIFQPLGMTETRYLPFDKACGPHHINGSAIAWAPVPRGRELIACLPNTWSTSLLPRTAPTAHDNEGTPATNPDYDHLLRGTVHDPTTRRMGGVAGHAGVFSTAHDISLFAQALLSKLLNNTGPFPLKQSTLQLMTTPEQPGHTPQQIPAANAAQQASIGHEPGAPSVAGLHPATGGSATIPGLAPHYPAIPNQNLRGYGWDIDTAFSKPRGLIFPIGSFGHTGFTGTSLWMDPASNTYVILLANAIHPRGNPPISNLRGQVATAAAQSLSLDQTAYQQKDCDGKPDGPPVTVEQAAALDLYCRTSGATDCPGVQVCATSNDVAPTDSPSSSSNVTTNPPQNPVISTGAQRSGETPACRSPHPNSVIPPSSNPATIGYPEASASGLIGPEKNGLQPSGHALSETGETLTGIDVLEQQRLAPLLKLAKGAPGNEQPVSLGLLTNQSGIDRNGLRTVDVLRGSSFLMESNIHLTTLFSPEHGITGALDTTHISSSTDPGTHLPVISLYGLHNADRRPTHAQLKDLDAVVIDLQDAGVHFWTYEAAVGYFLEAASTEVTQYHHNLEIILLDRPNLIGGTQTQGPISDPGTESYVNYMPLPIRHGLTLGELARYIVGTKHLSTHLTVIPMQHWSRTDYFADTRLPWINPSPNLRSPEAAIRYPALGLIEYNNISVGRGTDHPFSFFGAGIPPTKPSTSTATGGRTDASASTTTAWFKATEVANYLTARNIPGVTFTPTAETIAEDANHYPFHGQTIEAVRVTLTDPKQTDTPELGIEILAALHHLYPTQFNLPRAMPLVCNQATMDAITRGDDPRSIAATWQPALDAFRAATTPYLLYK
jgi:SSS family transporter